MGKNVINLFLVLLFVSSFIACGGSDKTKEAEALYQKANQEFIQGRYNDAIADLNRLRKDYHQQVEQRRKGLTLRHEVELKMAQNDLAKTDSALQSLKNRFDVLQKKVGIDKSKCSATPSELTELTTTRIRRDSLQVRFDVICAKIKFIHKKQQEE